MAERFDDPLKSLASLIHRHARHPSPDPEIPDLSPGSLAMLPVALQKPQECLAGSSVGSRAHADFRPRPWPQQPRLGGAGRRALRLIGPTGWPQGGQPCPASCPTD